MSSSSITFTTCWAGVMLFMTSSDRARTRTRSSRSSTTSTETSASSRAVRISPERVVHLLRVELAPRTELLEDTVQTVGQCVEHDRRERSGSRPVPVASAVLVVLDKETGGWRRSTSRTKRAASSLAAHRGPLVPHRASARSNWSYAVDRERAHVRDGPRGRDRRWDSALGNLFLAAALDRRGPAGLRSPWVARSRSCWTRSWCSDWVWVAAAKPSDPAG